MASGILSQLSSRFSGSWTKKRVDEADAEDGKVKKKKKTTTTQDLDIRVRVSEGTVSVQRFIPAEAEFESLPIRGEENSGEDQASPIDALPECFRSPFHEKSPPPFKSIIRICGQDAKGRPIVIIDATKVPRSSCLRYEAVQHILDKLDPIADAGDYDLIFIMSPNLDKGDESQMLPAWWCLKVYKNLPRLYRKNIRQLLFIHPTFYTRLLCHILRPFVSNKALRKVKHLADLEKASGGDICLEVLHLGTHVFKYDQTSST